MGEHTEAFGRMLDAAQRGDQAAEAEIWQDFYHDIKALARARLRDPGPVTLSATDLVHEVYVKIGPAGSANAKNRGHFTALVCTAMRQILIEEIRKKGAQKRGAFLMPNTLDEEKDGQHHSTEKTLAIHQALEKLTAIDPKLVQIVECRYFGGLTMEESAVALDISLSSANRLWSKARLHLARYLFAGEPDGDQA